ncbi:hypothetical protein [Bdellovibrio sp. HCB209]|uniref:hypothetical protein n=1 Tax=Bdellovibrio sp. HCB209 TaxID=3394354 RepID=UPI0039B50C60
MLKFLTSLSLVHVSSVALASNAANVCETPNYIAHAVSSERAPGVNQSDIKTLRSFLKNNDRAGMYLMLYRLTGEEFWLMDAQITTFSGIWGGTALETNYQIKLRNQDKYDDSIDKFSLKIATNMLKWVEKSVADGERGIVDIGVLLMKGDGEVWKSKGLLNEYPGRVLFFNLIQYQVTDFHNTLGLGSLYSAYAVVQRGGQMGKRIADFEGNPNFSILKSKDDRFVTVLDNRTCKVEAFIDNDTRPLGVLKQTLNKALDENDPEYYDRLWLWEFMQGNQDTAEEYNSAVWQNGRPLPNPNIKGRYYHNAKTGGWHYANDKEKVASIDVINALNEYRRRTMKFRISKGMPAEPQLPGRYKSGL